MANQPIETQVAVLKEQTSTLHNDLSEMKGDIKEIKELLINNFVTKVEFNAYKRAQNVQKVYLSTITAIITAILTYEITNFIRN